MRSVEYQRGYDAGYKAALEKVAGIKGSHKDHPDLGERLERKPRWYIS